MNTFLNYKKYIEMVDIDNSDYSAYMTFFKTVLIWT